VDNFKVKDLMVPISEYATVSEGATLYEAIQALEKAQEVFEYSKYAHRAVLVLNQDEQVIGKLSQLDVLRALAPDDPNIESIAGLSQFGFSSKFIRALLTDRRLQGAPLRNLCINAAQRRVEEFMQAPTEGEYVDASAPLDTAVHQLVQGSHLSLLVTQEKKIIGILRLTDVFAAVFHTMKEAETENFPENPKDRP
jgi:CBS domain-containing protein